MREKSIFAVTANQAKRVLLVDATRTDAKICAEHLRRFGYVVDCVDTAGMACSYTRNNRYNVIVIALAGDARSSEVLYRKLRRISPDSAVAYLTRQDGPLPGIPFHNVLWSEEQPEYFLARLEAISAA
jgi:CheY-like chemotaxis protein